MPDKYRLNCYFGRINDGPLLHFPNPKTHHLEDQEKFSTWKAVLDAATKEKGNIYIYNHIRLCNNHFMDCYKLPSRYLTKNAVPTLNLEQYQMTSDVQLSTPESAGMSQPLTSDLAVTSEPSISQSAVTSQPSTSAAPQHASSRKRSRLTLENANTKLVNQLKQKVEKMSINCKNQTKKIKAAKKNINEQSIFENYGKVA